MSAASGALTGLPLDLGGEMKWCAWNNVWHTVNCGLAAAWQGDPAEDKRRAAEEDLKRIGKHCEAIKKTGRLSASALRHFREQAEAAGKTALSAVLAGRSLHLESVPALAQPSELHVGLWRRMVRAIGIGAASITETALCVSPATFHHWHKGQTLEKDFEKAWNNLYETPPPPPPPPQERTVPPKPLTAEWLAKRGGLKGAALRAAREEPLAMDEDTGMTSSCNLLWLRRASNCPEDCYIAKRSLGTPAQHWTAGSLHTEFRFYDKVVREGAWPKAAELLAKALHVPRLLVANWGPDGQELEGFLLVMERLAAPQWQRAEPAAGCSEEQALAASAALGRLHGHFDDDGELGALPFLGVKPLGNEGQFEAGFAFGFLKSLGGLPGLLPAGGFRACQRMLEAGVGRLVRRLMQPPLTLLHGDFKLENLRFGGSRVAAFDFGLVTRGRGAWDFAYFLAHALAPPSRRKLEGQLVRTYLEERQRALTGGGDSTVQDSQLASFRSEVRSALLCVLGKLVIVLADYQGSEQVLHMLQRNASWAGAAVVDWNAVEELETGQ